ncbi:MAG: helix-turn-helix transcriptional regulator [Solirubrobacterales bacterium]|nr:helix-turn-helix transcriptional regulator [Solirubrobacterales bacterium]
MSSLRTADVRAVLDLVGEVHHADDLDEFREALVGALPGLVPADYSAYNEVPLDGSPGLTLVRPDLPEAAHEAWERHGTQNPILRYYERTRDGRAYRFSDVTTRQQLVALDLYKSLYEPMGIAHQVAVALPAPPQLVIGVVLSRGGTDFRERDRAVLNLARPHMIQAYRNAELRERTRTVLAGLARHLDDVGESVAVVDRFGEVVFASAAAREALAAAAGAELRERARVPEVLARWLAGEDSAQLPLLLGDATRPLAVRRLPARRDEPDVLLFEPGTRGISAALLEGLGLTPREAQVMQGVVRGLPTPEIAAQLDISPRTVHKHVERIFGKLGVHDRVGAVATAWAAVGTSARAPRAVHARR